MKSVQKYLLIVEDEVDLAAAYKRILATVTDNIAIAQDGVEALDIIAKKGDPAILFLDLRMPRMDGLEFLEQFKAPSHPTTEIILFSNYDMKKEVDAAFELGIHRYILKARMTPNELIKITKTVLDQKKN